MSAPGFTNPINNLPKINVTNPTDVLDSIKSQLFPSIHLSADAELALAVVLCAGGVFCMLFGHRFLRDLLHVRRPTGIDANLLMGV